jgi:hypothetical protein
MGGLPAWGLGEVLTTPHREMYHATTHSQINAFTPRPSHSAIDGIFSRCNVKVFRRSALAGGRGLKIFFHPDPLSAAVVLKVWSADLPQFRKINAVFLAGPFS